MLLLRNPSSVSCPIHSELRFIKLEWNTFSPYPGLPRTMTRVRYSVCFLFFFFFVYPLFYYIRVFVFFYTSILWEKASAQDRRGPERSIVKRRMKADLYCAREVNKAERIVTAASRYIVIYLNIIFPQRIEGIIVFAHITPYYQSSLVDVSTRDLLFFTYPWFNVVESDTGEWKKWNLSVLSFVRFQFRNLRFFHAMFAIFS